ncbi:MAG: DUF1501 domain-containing protein [Planctomycetaceae bacterium]
MAVSWTCDGLERRDFLKVGALGAGLTLSNYLRLASAGETSKAKANAAIFIHLAGGPSHLDTFDLKPESSDEYRGEFKPIESNIPGVRFSEHLPKLAKCADKFAILRGVSHTLAAHDLGSEYVNTGNRPLASLEYPGIGSVVSRELRGQPDLPQFVGIPSTIQGGGYLGVKYSPLNTQRVPQAGQPFSVRGITLGKELTISEVEKRNNLMRDLDKTFRGHEADSSLLDGLDRFSKQAHEMIISPKAREAFDVSQESPEFAKQFGTTPFGMSCLLATRLVESGVRFVTVSFSGWDTHYDNWTKLKTNMLPPLDEGLSALFNGLESRGLLKTTAVVVTGEFGRTPKINTERNGRDHYPRAMFALMAGGGMKGGQVLGASDKTGSEPAERGYSPDDMAATLYHTLGIDHHHEYHTNTGRPVMIVRDGHVIHELFG